jgi:hypothetical protein
MEMRKEFTSKCWASIETRRLNTAGGDGIRSPGRKKLGAISKMV